MKKLSVKLAVVASMLIAALNVNAQEYSNIYVFGDSLSDNGNLRAIAPDQTYGDRFTNGPVAVEVLAAGLGFSLTPSLHLLQTPPFGNNYAVAGAKAVDEDGNEQTPDINLPTQVNAFLQINGGQAPADALYIVLIGGNDIREAREIQAGEVFAANWWERLMINIESGLSIKNAVDSQIAQIKKLINAGAQHILVANAPDIGAIPETALISGGLLAQSQTNLQKKLASNLPTAVTRLSHTYNFILNLGLGHVEHVNNMDILDFDLFGYLSDQISNASSLGYTNTTEACIWIFSQGGTVNPACNYPTAENFLFWDEIHPTTKAHQGAGLELLDVISAQ
jgi:phospholipase/lecithinase/hemolysin